MGRTKWTTRTNGTTWRPRRARTCRTPRTPRTSRSPIATSPTTTTSLPPSLHEDLPCSSSSMYPSSTTTPSMLWEKIKDRCGLYGPEKYACRHIVHTNYFEINSFLYMKVLLVFHLSFQVVE